MPYTTDCPGLRFSYHYYYWSTAYGIFYILYAITRMHLLSFDIFYYAIGHLIQYIRYSLYKKYVVRHPQNTSLDVLSLGEYSFKFITCKDFLWKELHILCWSTHFLRGKCAKQDDWHHYHQIQKKAIFLGERKLYSKKSLKL